MRTILLAVALAAAVAVPIAVAPDAPRRPMAAAASPERPDRVFATTHLDHLPFGMPYGYSCDCNVWRAALLVQDDALWLGDQIDAPVRVPRDGNEWAVLERLLRDRGIDHVRDFQVAVHDDATYEDLLTAMVVARSTGIYPRVVQPALPVYPHHGYGGGMPPYY